MAAGNNSGLRRQTVRKCLRRNLMVVMIAVSIILGISLGCAIRTSWSPSDKRKIFYLKVPGEIMMNMLRMVSVPLVVSSIISSVASLSMKTSGRIGMTAVVYYLGTTVCSVITGTVGIVIISNGKKSVKQAAGTTKGTSQLDALLDMLRNAFPDNLVEATLSKKQSVMPSQNVEFQDNVGSFVGNQTIVNVTNNGTVKITTVEVPTVISVPGSNILGLIVASIFIGCILSSMEDKGKPLVDFFQTLYLVMMKMVLIFIWCIPIGLMFLIASIVVGVERPRDALQEFALFIPTVIICLLLHGFGTVPMLYFVVTRKNPYVFLKNMSKALITAFGSASSAAALPFTMDCLIRKNKVDKRVVNFIAPIGATINMDGTAVYIPMLLIFISHQLGLSLSPARYVVIGLSAIGVSVGAAAIPAGLMYMTVAAMAVGLPVEQVLLTAPFEWVFGRCRTTINVMGDSFGAGIVDHLCRSMLSSEEKELEHEPPNQEDMEESNNLV
ncbi:excitatory amino acid transporter 1-like isoform X2 [Argopecten irradians]